VTSMQAGHLDLDIEYDDDHAVLSVRGDVDVYTHDRLRTGLLAINEAGHHRIAVDLTGLNFCDSTGLGVLVHAVKRATAGGGGIALYGSPEHFLRVLRVTGLTKVMPPFAERAEALQWLAAQ